jgi:hypothetical protein
LPNYIAAFFWRFAPEHGRVAFAIGWASALGLVLSGVGMFNCLRRFDVRESPAVVAAIAYMWAPYHYAVDLLDRGAYSEFWAFVWMPLIAGGIADIREALAGSSKSQLAMGREPHLEQLAVTETLKLAVWIACLFLTHVITSITFAAAVLVIAACAGWKSFRHVALATAIALGLTAIYWLPLAVLGQFINASHWDWSRGDGIANTLFFPTCDWSKPISSNDVFNTRLLHIFIGFILVYAVAILTDWRVQAKAAPAKTILWCTVLAGCLAMMLPIAQPVYNHIPAMRRIQFGWRFMSCATLAHCIIAGLLLNAFWTKDLLPVRRAASLWFGRIAALVVLGVAVYLGGIQSAQKWPEAFFANGKFRSTPASVDVFAHDSFGEIMPVTANEPEALNLFRNEKAMVRDPRYLAGDGQIKVLLREPRRWTFEVKAASAGLIVVPQYWFQGWRAFDAASKRELSVRPEVKSGLIQLEAPSGCHVIALCLSPTWSELCGIWISAACATGLGLTVALCAKKSAFKPKLGDHGPHRL